MKCIICKTDVTQKVADYSAKKYGKILCYNCQKENKEEVKEEVKEVQTEQKKDYETVNKYQTSQEKKKEDILKNMIHKDTVVVLSNLSHDLTDFLRDFDNKYSDIYKK